MVTHKLHLHDNKMDGSCITTPSEAVNIALLLILPFPLQTPPLRRKGAAEHIIGF